MEPRSIVCGAAKPSNRSRTRPCVCGEGACVSTGIRMSRLSAWHGFEVDMSLLATDMAWVLSWLCHVLKPLLADFGRSISTEPNGSISRAGLVPRRGENLQLSAGPICSSELNTESSFTMTVSIPIFRGTRCISIYSAHEELLD